MKSAEVRRTFLAYFGSKQHKIVPSAPMVVKNDPTLMFTNAGMNQFKDIFLGNAPARYSRIADTQKCLRVSGKHNDLEEVGHDTYHHTMFEMLGNWSFGDYFKKEAIEWAWELLTKVYGVDSSNLYATVFEGDSDDSLVRDEEAFNIWSGIIPADRLLLGSKKDNFWEMGETGPCGPCSEIHIDLRSEEEKARIPGRELVNKGNPLVLEIWNLVFIEFNRQTDGKLVQLPQKHVDTGMGFERLTMVIQGKKSNYDTDVFQPVIATLGKISDKTYGEDDKQDIAMRVIADHLRAIAFAIADGQLPSNTGAGYVIRRILRRAVRYGYTFLGLREPFIHSLVNALTDVMGDYFPELIKQGELIRKVIAEEEQSFLRTLSQGIRKFDQYMAENSGKKVIEGGFAFELFDTYGFPVDLTRVMAAEQGWEIDMDGFHKGLEEQKSRSRQAAQVDTQDWVNLLPDGVETIFLGYETLEAEVEVVKYRKVKAKGEEFYEIVLNRTPFYAESGGQVGDRGYLECGGQRIDVSDTYKENELIIHKTREFFQNCRQAVHAVVDLAKRIATENNHSATHLMHAALRSVLGTHVEQKGSLVDEDHLRFDFSHFARMTEEEIRKVEVMVNQKIRENITSGEMRHVPLEEAKKMGAMALFGEKYGEEVRVITFDPEYSVELCGGTHVPATGQIGLFKIISEGAIAAGVRRIEAVTGEKAEAYIYEKQAIVSGIQEILKGTKELVKGVNNLVEENKALQRKIDELNRYRLEAMKSDLLAGTDIINGIRFIATKLDGDAAMAKDLAFSMNDDNEQQLLLFITTAAEKVNITLMLSAALIREKGLHAGNMIRELAKAINGGGGGQPHFATAGGSNPKGIPMVIEKAREIVMSDE
ncbi:MAG: alanine--tRNA ligase [Bacteroidales bacterium]|nr:alanine--tRNA ligase [Bacteroidales bacterium]